MGVCEHLQSSLASTQSESSACEEEPAVDVDA